MPITVFDVLPITLFTVLTVIQEVRTTAAMVRAILMEMMKGETFAITSDHWTSNDMVAYLAITGHFIDSEFNLHSVTLGCNKHSGEQTGIETKRAIIESLTSLGLSVESMVCVVTDTAPNMTLAGRLYDCDFHYCADHVLELTTGISGFYYISVIFGVSGFYFLFITVVHMIGILFRISGNIFLYNRYSVKTVFISYSGAAFKYDGIPDADEVMKSCRTLVGHFTGSSQAMAHLLASQSSTSSPLSVIQDVVTRWWSTHSMLKRLIKLKNYFAVLVTEGKLVGTLTDSQWVTVQDICDILEPFMFAQLTLEGQKYVTISIIPYIIYKCRQGLTDVKNNAGTKSSVKTLVTQMLSSFNAEWGSGIVHHSTFDCTNISRTYSLHFIFHFPVLCVSCFMTSNSPTSIPEM